ncbi:MAG: hypothetical protein HKN19_08035 [Halioglobus sp.]|nr:hypothetical protein [Halioglobus sp.]
MKSNTQHILLSVVAAIAVLCSAAVKGAPMAEDAAPAASQAQLLASAVSYLEQGCGLQPYCGSGEPLLVTLLEGWERDVRLKLADLVAVRFGFALPEQHEQFIAPVENWAPVFHSDYHQVTLSPAHSIKVRSKRYEPWR